MLKVKEILARTVGLLAVLSAGFAHAQGDPLAAARAEFQAAYRAADAKPPPASDSKSLQDYPLYPYLVAARLENRLGDPSAAGEIEAFLDGHGDAPVARSLRRSWLMTLAERKDWTRFLAAYRPDVDDTTAALCGALSARVALGRTEGLADDVINAWLSPKSLPEACDPPFDWARAQGRLTPDLIERRARLALADGNAGLARYLAKSLPESQSGPILQWITLIERPRAGFDALIADPKRSVEPEAMLDGWQRYARADADAAAALYPSLVQARGLDAAAASPYALAVALPLSWNRHPRALEFFALGRAEDFDERAHEWQVRAALWAGNWTRARDGLAAMPETLRNQNRWRYWSARVAEQLGDREAASAGYAAVLPTDNWYAALSAVRTGQPYAPTPVPLATDEALLARVAAKPGMVRTRELLLCEMQGEANYEWRAALETLDRDAQVQAVRLASSWGWYLPSIAAAAKLGLFDDYDLLYPRPYDDEVRRAAASTRLPASLIYAIIRQESLYRADAASSAGALGLMQLLPSTAQATARRAGLPRPTRASLLIPSVNIPLGSAYLRGLLDRVDSELPLAIAGYNAGPAAVRRWLPPTRMETDVWVENIPYNETRAYVQRVHWHSLVFDWLTDRKPRDVSSWLGSIGEPENPSTAEGEDGPSSFTTR